MYKDPVCGMTVEPSTAAGTYEHGGTTYAFLPVWGLSRPAANGYPGINDGGPVTPGTGPCCARGKASRLLAACQVRSRESVE